VREGSSPKIKEKTLPPSGRTFFDDDSPSWGTTFDDSPSMSFASRSVATSPMMNAVEETERSEDSASDDSRAPPESSAFGPSGSPEAARANAGVIRLLDATARYNTSEARVTVLLAKGALLMSVIRGRGAFVKRWGGLVGRVRGALSLVGD